MALYFPDRASLFKELRVGDAAAELYGKQSREQLRSQFGDAAQVFKNKTPAQREKTEKK